MQIATRLSPSNFIFVGVRGEPGNEAEKPLYMHLAYLHRLNECGTWCCSLHSFPHKRQFTSFIFSISQRNLKLPTYHIDLAPLTLPAYKTDYTCYAHNAATHNITSSPCTSACTTHQQYPRHCLPQPSYTHNKHIHSYQNGTRCREGVNVLWCCSHLV